MRIEVAVKDAEDGVGNLFFVRPGQVVRQAECDSPDAQRRANGNDQRQHRETAPLRHRRVPSAPSQPRDRLAPSAPHDLQLLFENGHIRVNKPYESAMLRS